MYLYKTLKNSFDEYYIVISQCDLSNISYCFEWYVNKTAQNHDHLDFCNIRNHARIYSHWTSMKKELQHRRSQIIDMKNEKFLHKWQVKVKHVISHMRLQKLHMYNTHINISCFLVNFATSYFNKSRIWIMQTSHF